ncbi:class I SAM-dependent DNA methyltransferase [Thiomonas arsenitoxydans]|uniref:class I SAM-dependent DNA methyltransferase n=1 Tax=Thiomonas arsenitoxydans (strain DSM 22701 / CIP 110005 / 3As) TaxID=426114 RepID=UPI001ACF241F|nr:DNA methyltransferase [Thiomonas arsenitoxydans]MBN8777769.1 class I SAM-dependent DNA methyltransferase [Thiomonas arsenitoxydans]
MTAHPSTSLSAVPHPDAARAADFIARWSGVAASELSTAQSFVRELCELLGVPVPHPTPELDYMFERPITFRHGDGSSSPGRIDCYRRGAFVLEAKKLRASADTRRFDDALLRARAQAEGYARALEPAELAAGGRPPFLLVVDVGQVIELYAEFTRSGATYTPFPDPRSHRIALADLARAEVRDTLRRIWLDPFGLDPARASARVTREVAAQLAELARSLEASGHAPQLVAAYLTRCLFSMFAEDVGLLPGAGEGGQGGQGAQGGQGDQGGFVTLLKRHRDDPATLQRMLAALWADMDRGGFSVALAQTVLRFNGKLFKGAADDAYSLPLNRAQVDLLLAAARANWREVEPAIFGALLERALDPAERHALGAHYTPRAYVERLVLPTVMEPLRREWADAQAAALLLAHEAAELDGRPRDAKMDAARAELRRFHHRLCTLRVLDPACGSGNFLYVTLEHLKRLEGEVLNQLGALGETQNKLALEGETVTPQQLLGLEVNARAAALAELVLWIGYLQWHIRTRGDRAVAEPVVQDYGNIVCRDAVLAWSAQRPLLDAQGRPRTRWDGRTYTVHPATGEPVPDPAAQVPQWAYDQPRPADWPQADYIVGNPPFIGAAAMRAALGDGYVDALRSVWPEMPESADFVMFWWHAAARKVAAGQARRFGFITTNSLRQTFNRRVVQSALNGGLHLVYAIPDHPWVDSASGAAVRIAMTVAEPGAGEGRLQTVITETPGEHGEMTVQLREQTGLIHADLTVGPNLLSAQALRADLGLSNRGVQLFGAGFIVTPEQAAALRPTPALPTSGEGAITHLPRRGDVGKDMPTPALPTSGEGANTTSLAPPPPRGGGWEGEIVRPYRNGRDLTDAPRGVLVIDLFGLDAEQVRSRYPAVYQWLLERVKPERDQNNRASRREKWWLFGETNPMLRKQLAGLPRYIATVETAKHRTFQFLDASILPDNKLIAIALDDAFHLGVLSSSTHVTWALAQGSTLEDRPVYVKTRCFETFPFPDADTGLTPALRQRIAERAEAIDAHRKQVLAAHPGALTLTALYNVLDALRAGRALTPKERTVHQLGLVAVLAELHAELDAAVLAAYGWSDLAAPPHSLSTCGEGRGGETGAADLARAVTLTLLTRLLALNHARAAEEAAGTVRWLRPAFQHPQTNPVRPTQATLGMGVVGAHPIGTANPARSPEPPAQPWPSTLPEQMRAVADLLAASAQPLDLEALTSRFKGRGPWKKSLPRILETLEALGRARREGQGWRG